MSNLQEYFPVNNQEDEDGYMPNPGNAMIDEQVKRQQDTNSGTTIPNVQEEREKLQIRSFMLSSPTILGKVSDR